MFNQTDVTYRGATGSLRHTVLVGAEVGRQLTDNFRNTGFFNNTATSILVPFEQPDDHDAGHVPPERDRRRQPSADQRRRASTRRIRSSCRARARWSAASAFDRFDLQYHNNRNGDTLDRVDDLVSPRAGVVVKPVDAAVALRQLQRLVSAELRRPVLLADGHHAAGRAGEVHQLRGRREVGRAAGAVVDRRRLPARPHQHALDGPERSDADRPDRQPAHQRLRARRERQHHARLERSPAATPIRTPSSPSATAAARGRRRRSARCRTTRSRCGTSTSSTRDRGRGARRRPSHGDVRGDRQHGDAARLHPRGRGAFFTLTRRLRLQANVENLFDASYFVNADSNTNISPGSPRALRVALTTTF